MTACVVVQKNHRIANKAGSWTTRGYRRRPYVRAANHHFFGIGQSSIPAAGDAARAPTKASAGLQYQHN